MAAKHLKMEVAVALASLYITLLYLFYDFIADYKVCRSFVWPTRQLDAIVAIARLSKTTQKFLRVY